MLAGAAHLPARAWTHYRVVGDGVELDVDAFLEARGSAVSFVRDLLSATVSRPAQLGCFGLHEWAMVHGIPADDVRHAGWPLRLGSAGTDAVVERHGIRCSHFDAYRFFTDSASPRNALRPTRDSQVAMEQPGCLHAGMDVYKWAFKLTPLVPSDLVADAFDLAREIRVLDMQASPYDLRELGHEPVPIETAEGKAAYLERQRRLRRAVQRAAPPPPRGARRRTDRAPRRADVAGPVRWPVRGRAVRSGGLAAEAEPRRDPRDEQRPPDEDECCGSRGEERGCSPRPSS